MLFPLILLLAALLFVPAVWALAVVVATLIMDVPPIRRREWIAANPQVVSASDDVLSPIMQMLITQLGPSLEAAGFKRAAGLHAPEFSGYGGWTQILYLNHETGERASFIQAAIHGVNTANLFIATELEGMDLVVNGLPPGPVTERDDLSGLGPELLQRHRRQIRDVTSRGDSDPLPRGLVPEPGQEFEWLTRRVEAAAKESVGLMQYRYDPRQSRFAMPWPAVLKLAFQRRRDRRMTRGFDVVTPAASTEGVVTIPPS